MNDKLDEIIARLQSQQPEPDCADELTDMIMDSLPELPAETPVSATQHRVAPIVSIVRNFSSAAAIFLFILFAWQNVKNPFFQQSPDTPDYEQCIANYKPDYSSITESSNPRESFNRYFQQRESKVKYLNKLKSKSL